MKILFLGDLFGVRSINTLKKHLPQLIKKYEIDFVIAQSENVSGRKGMIPKDYENLKKAGINAFTMGNHVWAKQDIDQIIHNDDVIRPINTKSEYPGAGSRIFKVRGKTIRVSQFMGIAFNPLNNPWREKEAASFFDAFDKLEKIDKSDYHIIDFHAETTSEKNVFGLYVDGKVSAFLGTHTHVQTNDARILPHGTAYITDVGMVGPTNSAIGASYETVYKKMRFHSRTKFDVSKNKIIINGVILDFNDKQPKIKTLKMPS